MKTFGLFMLLSLACFLVTFAMFQNSPADEILKFVFAQQLAFIMYKLVKEENKS
jgi:hypothetical protein